MLAQLKNKKVFMTKFIKSLALQRIDINDSCNMKQEVLGRDNQLLFFQYTLSDTWNA
jgi:hypothetical protein